MSSELKERVKEKALQALKFPLRLTPLWIEAIGMGAIMGAIVDGNKKFDSEILVIPIVKGDSKSFSIAAASILAKVTRDRLMKNLAKDYPHYLWEQNKGYPTKRHREIIRQIGPSPLHRKTFLKKIITDQQILEFDNVKMKVEH